MRVDVHTHIWPDRIADAVADSMESDLGFAPIASNTVEGIKAHMRESGVDKSIVLGVAARADQVRRANDWLISIADDMLVPFGAVHPDLEDKAGEIRHLRSHGVKGIKMHPVINGFYPDDPQWFPVYEELGDDMTLAIHSGRLPHQASDATLYAAPERIMNVVRRFPRLKVIALHLGGFYMLDEAERVLLGHENVLVDTTWPPSIRELTPETITAIIAKHGAHKVCFGTDYPLVDMGAESDYLASLPLSSDQVEGILGENARKFIGL
jgi:predicted TIM-barrel fold metal-dependent hydrolase